MQPDPRGRLRVVVRDGEPIWNLQCPQCGHWGDIDDDQALGEVSVDHSGGPENGGCGCGCTFHETRNWVKTAVQY